MGEKQFAQQLLMLLRDTAGSNSREAGAVLEWARDQREWLWPDQGEAVAAAADGVPIGWDDLRLLASQIDTREPQPPLLTSVSVVAELLDLGEFDRRLLETVAAFQRLPRLAILRARLISAGADLVGLIGQAAGANWAEAEARVRRSDALSLGLLCIEREYGGTPDVQLDWRFGKLIDETCLDEERIIEALVGVRQRASLTRSDFVELEAEVDLIVRLLRGALKSGARGVNLLIYGPPGTGKTELARTIAAEVGASLYAVGEADSDGDEPTRIERLSALNRAQRLLGRRNDSLLLFDELEDLFTEASFSVSGARRSGSKIFVNRLLEEVATPVIWTSNSLDSIDAAHLRRLSYILRLGHPQPETRRRIAVRAGEAEAASDAVAGLDPLLDREAESASIARVALRTAALAGGRAEDASAAGQALLRGMRGGRAPAPGHGDQPLDLSLYDADQSVEALVERLADKDGPVDFSLLLSGPPGTGKTALAAHIARRLGRPLVVKRSSDLLSKWVGETEANIADAFADAREDGAVLLFDEADSLLLDRSDARQSWEITQVNEMLTWMDRHPLPFIAATNFSRRLDPAAFRRFLFKVDLRPLQADALERAFERFFDVPAPRGLCDVRGLTPGDFALVKRQLRYRADSTAPEILELLKLEANSKCTPSGRIGF